MISPEALVPRALQVFRLTESLTKRTEPSAWTTFTPPEWKLRAAMCDDPAAESVQSKPL